MWWVEEVLIGEREGVMLLSVAGARSLMGAGSSVAARSGTGGGGCVGLAGDGERVAHCQSVGGVDRSGSEVVGVGGQTDRSGRDPTRAATGKRGEDGKKIDNGRGRCR